MIIAAFRASRINGQEDDENAFSHTARRDILPQAAQAGGKAVFSCRYPLVAEDMTYAD
jgi:hypothetical protein